MSKAVVVVLLVAHLALAGDSWVTYKGGDGPGKGRRVVLISGDEEYRSEEALTQLGRILAARHGFDCTVLFAINPADGTIDPVVLDNIPGLEALETADLMIIAARFRNLPEAQMKHIAAYLASGKPVIGMRTATHAFRIPPGLPYARYSFDSTQPGWEGGFGRRILGETWIDHHGRHGGQSTRGLVIAEMKGHPIVRGCDDIWGPTDVYKVRLPLPTGCIPLVAGQVRDGMQPDSGPAAGAINDPMMPIAWTKTYQVEDGREGRVFTTTMGSADDLSSAGVRRLLVNAAYWCVGLAERIPPQADVRLVGDFKPLPFGYAKHRKGIKPADHQFCTQSLPATTAPSPQQ